MQRYTKNPYCIFLCSIIISIVTFIHALNNKNGAAPFHGKMILKSTNTDIGRYMLGYGGVVYRKAFLLLCMLLVAIAAPLQAQETAVQYDEQGRVVSSSHSVLDANDHLAVLITYTYDSAGVVETRTLQSYDRQGRPLRKEVYSVDEYLLYTEDNRYDRHGNRTRCLQTTYDADGRPDRSIYRYTYRRIPDGSWQLAKLKLNGQTIFDASNPQ